MKVERRVVEETNVEEKRERSLEVLRYRIEEHTHLGNSMRTDVPSW